MSFLFDRPMCIPCRKRIWLPRWWLHAWRRHNRKPWRRYAHD